MDDEISSHFTDDILRLLMDSLHEEVPQIGAFEVGTGSQLRQLTVEIYRVPTSPLGYTGAPVALIHPGRLSLPANGHGLRLVPA
jgi:hypothetical protein